MAVERQNIQCVATLLINRSQPHSVPLNANVFNDSGLTPFHLAVAKNDAKMCELLAKKTESDKVSVLNKIDRKKGFGALHIAVENRATDVVEYLLKNNLVDVNQRTGSNLTALSIARNFDNGSGDIIAILLKHGAENSEPKVDAVGEEKHKNIAVKDVKVQGKGALNEISDHLAKVKLVDVNLRPIPNLVILNPELRRSAKPIDPDSLTRLCEIFNKDDKWQSLAEVLGYQSYIENWKSARSPSKAVFMFSEVC